MSLDRIEELLREAEKGAKETYTNITGASAERVWNHIYAAEARLMEVAPKEELAAWGWDALAMAYQHLGPTDPRRATLEKCLISVTSHALSDKDRELAVHTLRAAQSAASTEKMQARNFRNVLRLTTLILTVIAVWLAFLGGAEPHSLQLCFRASSPLVCPASDQGPEGVWDVLLVEVIGMAAAALTAAVALRNLDGTSTPYSIPFTLAVLKLPAGALSAVIGLILVNASVIPGLHLTTREQILAWAAIFGAGQQAITRFIDSKGQQVLDNVRGSESKSRPPDSADGRSTLERGT